MRDRDINNILKKLITGVIVMLVLIGIILAARVVRLSGEKKKMQWQDGSGELGTITEDYEQGDAADVREDIVDAYGNEYSYTKIPSMGIATYIPKGWEFYGDGRYIYVSAPDDSEMKYTEIAICTNNLEDKDLSSKGSITGAVDYVLNSLKYHTHELELNLSLTSDNSLTADYDYTTEVFITKDNGDYKEYTENPEDASVVSKGPRLVGYRSSPNLTFVDPNNVFTHTSPYAVLYFCKVGNSNQTAFFSVIGPRNYELKLEEMATTIGYNVVEYVSDSKDYNSVFTNVNLEKETIGDLFFFYKEDDDTEKEKSVNSVFVNTISKDPLSLGYGCKTSLVYKNGVNIEDTLTEDDMMMIWGMDDGIYEGYSKALSGNIMKPDFDKREVKRVDIANKETRVVEWNMNAKYIHNGRNYFHPNLPRQYYTYLIPSDKGTYIYTISYQTYQKYAARQYMDKVATMVGFN